MPNIPIVNAGISYVNGLGLEFVDFSDFIVFSGAARDSTNTNDIILNEQVSVSILRNGVNGIDQGPVVPNTRYAVYVIGDSTGYAPSAAMLSALIVPNVLPSGYDIYRRIGWVSTSNPSPNRIIQFVQIGNGLTRTYFYDVPLPLVTAGTSTVFANVFTAEFAPPFRTQISLEGTFSPAVATDTVRFNTVSSTSGGAVVTCGGIAVTANQRFHATIPLGRLFLSGAFKYAVTGGSVNISINSFEDNLLVNSQDLL